VIRSKTPLFFRSPDSNNHEDFLKFLLFYQIFQSLFRKKNLGGNVYFKFRHFFL
jgi:hypothetical protein